MATDEFAEGRLVAGEAGVDRPFVGCPVIGSSVIGSSVIGGPLIA